MEAPLEDAILQPPWRFLRGRVIVGRRPWAVPHNLGSSHETTGIPLTEYFPIFRVWVANWLPSCVLSGTTRNNKSEARNAGAVSSTLNQRAGKCGAEIRSGARS